MHIFHVASRLIAAMIMAASMNCSVKPADVVMTYDNIVRVETDGCNLSEYYGFTSETYVYLVVNGNGEIIGAF